MLTILYIILALLGLSFLVFIHELGHYFVARKEGMRVEIFSIGLGKPILSWMHKGVKWQLCPLLIGGYVRIAGMEKEGDLEPHEVPEGFYSKKPWARIKVALAGPIVNLIFALIIFTTIWLFGGREKPFHQFTHLIGFIEPQSELYQKGVHAGDELLEYNGKFINNFDDLKFAYLSNGGMAEVEGNKINYFTSEKVPYEYKVMPYHSPYLQKGIKTVGILAPAKYLIYQAPEEFSRENPLYRSGIENNDRIVWVDGQLIFSDTQLSRILNAKQVLIHFEREGKVLMGKIPRIAVRDLRLESNEEAELEDWSFEAGLTNSLQSSFFIPYALTADLEVEKQLSFVGKESTFQTVHDLLKTSSIDVILKPGDHIIAIDGTPVKTGSQFLKQLEKRTAQIIVKREKPREKMLWTEEDRFFETGTNWDALTPIIKSLGTESPLKQNDSFHLLNPITPVQYKNFPYPEKIKALLEDTMKKERARIEKINNLEEREKGLALLDEYLSQYVIGATLHDRTVIYNPEPFTLFSSIFSEITRNLSGLFLGNLSPKHFGGPVGVVHMMQQSWGLGPKEALFWLGAISLNLGVLNLLPIPVLDGGHICFSLIEAIRRKPLKAKTMRWMVFPFIAFLIFSFLYLTYNDISRLFGHLF